MENFSALNSRIKLLWWISLLIHLYTAYFSIGFHHYDEYFQIFEPLLGNILTWEYQEQIRPWFQIFSFKILLAPFSWLGLEDPFQKQLILRVFSSLLGFASLNTLWKYALKKNSHFNPLWSYIIIHFLWFIPYVHARSSAESIGSSLFIFSFCLLSSKRNPYIAGLISGAAFWVRFHLGFSVLFIWLFSLYKNQKKSTNLYFPLGVLTLLLIGLCIDSHYYNQWTFTPFQYIKSNIIDGKASQYGVSPWYQYFKWIFIKAIPPLSLFLIIPLFSFWRKRFFSFETMASLPFLLVHVLVSHKEYRFLFPLIPFCSLSILYFFPKLPTIEIKWKKYFILLLLIINFTALIFVMNKPAKSNFVILKYLYHKNISTLSSYKESPYSLGGLTMIGIKPKGMKVNIFDDRLIKETSSPDQWVLFHRLSQHKKFLWINNCQEVYSSLPKWLIKKLNSKKLSRIRVWRLFKCQNKQTTVSQDL